MNLTSEFDFVERDSAVFVYLERNGSFAEIALPTWNAMLPIMFGQIDDQQIRAFLGLSRVVKSNANEPLKVYQAGVAVSVRPEKALEGGLQLKTIEAGRYARFRLTGSYSLIWAAFDRAFQILSEQKVELRRDFCVEHYLNDPKQTPEDRLLTEILVPVLEK